MAVNMPDYANYNWARMKFEVEARYSGAFTATAETTGVTGVWQPTTFSVKKVVLTSGATVTSASQTINSIRLTQTEGESQVFRIRSWLDRNGNDTVDPFEPTTGFASVSTIDPSKAKSYLAFQVDPPRFADSKISASIGGNGVNKVGIIDPSLVSMKVHTCGYDGCVRVTGSLTYNSMPQLVRYEFSTATNFRSDGTYVVELFYAQTPSNSILLDSETFEYKQKIPNQIETSLTFSPGVSTTKLTASSARAPRLSLTSGPLSIESFTYKAKFSDPDNALIANREVYVYLDMKDIKSPANFLVDGVQVSPVVRDEVLLRRFTDSSGEINLDFTYPDATLLERLEIDIQVNGIRPYEFSNPGSEEAFVWDIDGQRNLGLYVDKTAGTSIAPVTLNALIFTAQSELVTEGAVVFTPDKFLVLENGAGTIDAFGRVSTTIRVSNLAPKNGQGYVTAQTVTASGLVSNKVLVTWIDFGKAVTVAAPTMTKLFGLLTNVAIVNKTATVTVYGLTSSDSVVICQKNRCLSASYNSARSVGTRVFPHIAGATYAVKVNGTQVFSRTYK
jgi:hypothetical protein